MLDPLPYPQPEFPVFLDLNGEVNMLLKLYGWAKQVHIDALDQLREFHWRLLLLGAIVCAFCGVATTYIVLKLGMSTDLSYGAMLLGVGVLGRRVRGRGLAIELNIIQTMVNAVTGIGFMCVILAAFEFIQGAMFHTDVGFHPTWWQIGIWVLVSANLGVLMGAIPRRTLLDDPELPWPAAVGVQSVIEAVTDEGQAEANAMRRKVFFGSTGLAAFITFLKDGFGVLPPLVGNASLKFFLGFEMAAFGLGMLAPLSVALSYLPGAWGILQFGDYVAKLVALNGTKPALWDQCNELLYRVGNMAGDEKATALATIGKNCSHGGDWLTKPHFALALQWFMYPATAMMITAALTSVLVPLVRSTARRLRGESAPVVREEERVSWPLIGIGIALCVGVLTYIQGKWFDMDWKQVLIAIAVQPLLIIAGLKVLGLTGNGPVSLVANATQFVFGIFWPKHVAGNLQAAHIAADPQASAEATITSFYVARRIGGRFSTLMIAQFIAIPIGAFLLWPSFNWLVENYGFGDGGLNAPTGIKIASLAMVMKDGVNALPRGALTASIIAGGLGVVMELLLMDKKKRFWWIPIPSVIGFAFILPPLLTIPLAIGGVVAALWRSFSPAQTGSFHRLHAPMAGGFIAGEAMVGAILLPLLTTLAEIVRTILDTHTIELPNIF